MSNSITKIDLGRLEQHASQQTRLMKQAVKQVALWKKRHSDAEANLEVVGAEVKRRIRLRPKKYGVTRVTDSAIKEAMIVAPEYQEAYKAVRQSKYKQDLMDGLVKTLEHRKRMIEVCVQLYGLDYFAKPSTKKGGDKYHEEAASAPFRRKRKKVKPVLDEDDS